MAKVSLVVVSYNGLAYLDSCLTSMRASVNSDNELMVIANGSTDGSPDLFARLCPDAILVKNETNVGLASACNQGAALACDDTLNFEESYLEHTAPDL
jgi:GT2 family glycosyltransferase